MIARTGLRCPACGHIVRDELDQRIRDLEAERLRPPSTTPSTRRPHKETG